MLAALAPAPPAPAHAGLAPARPATAHAGASAGVQAATQAQSRPAMVADPAFEPLPGAQVYVGALTGAGYRIEVPFDWNGELVLWAHGYRGENPQLEVSDPPIREWFV